AGIASGLVSAGINYLFDRRREKGKRVAEVAKEQLELYSAFLYNLRILHAAMDSFLLTEVNDQRQSAVQRIKEIADKIDQLLQYKIHLLNPGLWGTWSLVRQDFEDPDLFKLNIYSSYLAVNDLTINLDKVFSEVISKYEKIVVNFGYVQPSQDPYYEAYSKTRSDRTTKTTKWVAGRILEIKKRQQQDANNNSAIKPSNSNETMPEDEKKGENSAS
ncbi:MAG: hypothetical protein ACREAS_06730, partial [Nitrososphaera sp.]